MKILFIRLNAIGDITLTTGVLNYLKKNTNQSIEFYFLTLEKHRELVSFFPLEFSDVFFLDSKNKLTKESLDKINTIKFDIVMDWQSTFKSKKLLHLFRYKKLLTNNKQSLLRRIYVKTKWGQRFLNQHVTEKYLNPLKRELNLPSNVTLKELKPLFRFSTFKTEGVKNKKNIIIHPYASQRNKHWPHTVELIKFLANENYSFSIIGNSVKPISLPKNLEGKVKNLTNKTNLTELIRVINQSAAIITTDSGPMHLASALNIPTIALFGPTTKEFGFFPEFENCVILQDKSLICRPCHVHGGNHCSLGNRPCMNNLTVEKVAYELNQLLQIE